MSLTLVQVGPQGPHASGANPTQAAGPEAEALITQLHPVYHEATRRGRVFTLSSAATGIALPIYTTTSPLLVLWNPASSGRNAVLMRYTLGYVSGTSVAGAVGLMSLPNAGGNIGTGAPFSAFTSVDPNNGLIGGGQKSVMRCANAATNTLTTAGAWYKSLGISLYAATAAIAVAAQDTQSEVDGAIIVPPGTAVYLAASAASSALYAQSLIWEEIPVNP